MQAHYDNSGGSGVALGVIIGAFTLVIICLRLKNRSKMEDPPGGGQQNQ